MAFNGKIEMLTISGNDEKGNGLMKQNIEDSRRAGDSMGSFSFGFIFFVDTEKMNPTGEPGPADFGHVG